MPFRFASVAAISVVVAFLLFGWVAYPPIRQLLIQRETQTIESQLSLAIDRFSHSLDSLRQSLRHPLIEDLSSSLLAAHPGSRAEHAQRETLESALTRMMQSHPSFSRISLIDIRPGGRELIAIARDQEGGIVQQQAPQVFGSGRFRSFPTALKDLKSGEMMLAPADVLAPEAPESGAAPRSDMAAPRPVLHAITPIWPTDAPAALGYLIADLSVDRLLDGIRASLSYPADVIFHDAAQGHALLVAAEHQSAVLLPLKGDSELNNRLSRLRGNSSEPGAYFLERDDGYLYAAREFEVPWAVPSRKFLVVSRSSDAAVMQAVRSSLQVLGIAGLSFALLAATLAGLWGAATGRPISSLARAIDRYAQEAPDARLPENASGEVGMLVTSFRRMRQEVDERTHRLRAEIARSRHLEEERTAFQERLIQNQKLEAVGSMAGGLAHDFNNLLTAVFGFAGLLSHSRNLAPHEREWIDNILTAAGRGRDLIKRVLTFSSQTEIERRELHMATLLHESVSLLRASVPSSIRLEVDSRTDAFIVGDETQLSQVILNLGTNAGHAVSPSSGEITITLDETRLDDLFCRSHPGLRPGRYVVLSVEDNGKGMTAECRDRIFEPFFTTKQPGEGTGLGLAVVHGIVRAHDGAIAVDSEEGRGSKFRIFLPAQTCGGNAPQDTTAEGAPVRPRIDGKILMVDDEESICTAVTQVLGSHGYSVDSRKDAIDALAAFLSDPSAYSVVITDQTMPGMTGEQLIAAIRQRSDRIPIILASGYRTRLTARRMDELAVTQLLSKPFSEATLLQALHRAAS